MRALLKTVYITISKIFLPIFFKKKYLQGKYFSKENSIGYRWAWRAVFCQRILGYNRHIPWPVSFRTEISNKNNIEFDINDLNNFQHFGCYYQNFNGKIILGKGTYIAPNVDKHQPGKDIILGKNCWIGMNSIILPGVKLGDKTIVGAGSVVTKSFEEGNCVLVGNPAKIIRRL